MPKNKVEASPKPPIAPGRIEVTNQNALRLMAGMSDIMVQQNKVIIGLLGSINASLTKPAHDLGGSDGLSNNKQQ